MLLECLRRSLTEPFQKLPAVIATFAAEAVFVLMCPGSAMYSPVNKLLLKGPALNIQVSCCCCRCCCSVLLLLLLLLLLALLVLYHFKMVRSSSVQVVQVKWFRSSSVLQTQLLPCTSVHMRHSCGSMLSLSAVARVGFTFGTHATAMMACSW